MKSINYLMQFEQQLLAAVLLLLHGLIWHVNGTIFQFPLTLVLYGLFLLWQPLWGKEDSGHRLSYLIPVSLLILSAYFYPNESIVFFCLLVAGLLGSRLFSYNTSRAFDLLAITLIILEMTIGIIPITFQPIAIPLQFGNYIQIVIFVPILLFFLAPTPERSNQKRSQIDLINGILTATLISIVVLGGIVINVLYGVDYIDGLLLTVFIVSTLAIGISWFWNPGVGYSGLGVLWNRYAMTIGGPFETWINTLTTLIEEPYISPNEFLQAACEHLVENDWLNGIEWQFKTLSLVSGAKKGVVFTHSLSPDIEVTIYFKSDPGQALRQHTILLIRMAYQFYLAKLNQDKMRAQEHFETIHHTGARLTHDIKNILQSIKTSINIIQSSSEKGRQQKTNKLLKQNLDQIGNRLESTLEKLKSPELSTSIKIISIQQWAKQFSNENSDPKLNFRRDISHNHNIPTDLFDSVISNLVSNALNKQDAGHIIIDISSNSEMIVVTVCDDGSPVDSELESNIFLKPISSGEGMGIGLYQSAIMARSFNYELELANNENGKVCFSLFQHLNDN